MCGGGPPPPPLPISQNWRRIGNQALRVQWADDPVVRGNDRAAGLPTAATYAHPPHGRNKRHVLRATTRWPASHRHHPVAVLLVLLASAHPCPWRARLRSDCGSIRTTNRGQRDWKCCSDGEAAWYGIRDLAQGMCGKSANEMQSAGLPIMPFCQGKGKRAVPRPNYVCPCTVVAAFCHCRPSFGILARHCPLNHAAMFAEH